MKRVDSEILTVEDLAELFSCDKETAAARLTTGDLPGVKVGRGWIVPRQALFERLNEKAKEEAATRRGQHASQFEAARQRADAAKIESKNIPQSNSAVYLPAKKMVTGGRRRRTPPVLPTLPDNQ